MKTVRHNRRFRWRALALLSAAFLLAAACGDDDDDDTATDDTAADDTADDALAQFQEEGVTIGIAPEPPYGFEEGGDATGEAPELIGEILSRLDIEVNDFEVVEFGSLIDGLAADRFDIIAAGMFVTPDRAGNVLFSNPEVCPSQNFAVPEGNPDNISDFESVADSDATLAVGRGFVEADFAEDAGVPGDRLEQFETVADMFDALTGGRVDAVAVTRPTVDLQVEELEGFESTEGFFVEVDGETQIFCSAMGFRFDDQELRDAVNEVLAEMHEAGEVLPIVEEFGFTAEEVDLAADTTANQLAEGAYDEIGDPAFEG